MSEPTASRPTHLQRIATMFERAVSALGGTAPPEKLEEWSVLVHECMSGRGRRYHDVAHAYEVADSPDPVQVLAGLFHDTVYYQVDGGLSKPVRERVGDTVVERAGGLVVAPARDWLTTLVGAVFGFAEGRTLSPYAGLNEFLSAVVAVRSLSPTLGLADLTCIAACIEATIPFRSPGPDGTTASDALFARLVAASKSFDLGLDEAAVEAAVHRAVALANHDVANFAHPDATRFLDETWKLLPESNHALRDGAPYTVSEYREALAKMERFFATVTADRVFSRFRGRPDDATLAAMTDRARVNIDIGYRYLAAKRLTASLLAAIATLTGGDAPMSLFMGDLPHHAPASLRLEDFIPAAPPERAADIHPRVLQSLATGRVSDSGFDIKNSPLTAFLYQAMGDAATRDALAAWSDDDPFAWLCRLPGSAVRTVITACTHLAITRRARLEDLEQRLARSRA